MLVIYTIPYIGSVSSTQHVLIASDEGLLAQITTSDIPFFLTKRSGTTARLKSQIIQR